METETKNLQECHISPLALDDWEKYKALWLEALTNSPQAFAYSYQELADRTDKEWQEKIEGYSAERSKSRMFVAKDKNRFIGMMGFFEKEKGVAKIFGVYVSPHCRGKHVSDRLMESLLSALKELDFLEVELTVNKEQTAAFTCYKRHGFFVTEEIKDVKMGDGTICDEYVMKREVK